MAAFRVICLLILISQEGKEPVMKSAMMARMLFGCMILFAACGMQVQKEPPAGVQANEAMAKAVAQALVSRDFDAARADFDSTMQSGLSSEKLEEAWNQYAGRLGAFKDFGQATIEYAGKSPCIFIPCNFENGGLVVQVTQDSQGTQVTGLFLRPPGFSLL
jgi:hypothetical protein